MLNQPCYERDTVIDIIMPALSGDTAAALSRGLSRALCAHKPRRAAALAGFFTENTSLGYELASAGIEAGVGVAALKCPALDVSVAILAKLKTPGVLSAPDGSAVDLLCVLFYPEREGVQYLRRLSRLTRLLCNQDLCAKIRETRDVEMIGSLMRSPEGWMLAA